MTIPSATSKAFAAGTRTEQVRFVLNDAVRITGGRHKDRTGCVVSVFSLDPVTYLIEPAAAPWEDVQVAQSDLESLE